MRATPPMRHRTDARPSPPLPPPRAQRPSYKPVYSVPLFPWTPGVSWVLNCFMMASLPANAYMQARPRRRGARHVAHAGVRRAKAGAAAAGFTSPPSRAAVALLPPVGPPRKPDIPGPHLAPFLPPPRPLARSLNTRTLPCPRQLAWCAAPPFPPHATLPPHPSVTPHPTLPPLSLQLAFFFLVMVALYVLYSIHAAQFYDDAMGREVK